MGSEMCIRDSAICDDIQSAGDVLPPNTESVSFDHGIELRSIAFSYPEVPTAAVDGICMTIPKGSKIAFVGPSGSGKTTLVDLVMGLLEPVAGDILIDDLPLVPERYDAWRQLIGYVPQEVFLYNDTCLLYTSPSPRDRTRSRMPSSA